MAWGPLHTQTGPSLCAAAAAAAAPSLLDGTPSLAVSHSFPRAQNSPGSLFRTVCYQQADETVKHSEGREVDGGSERRKQTVLGEGRANESGVANQVRKCGAHVQRAATSGEAPRRPLARLRPLAGPRRGER